MAVAGERDADDLARPVSFAGVDRAAHQAMEAGDWPTAKTSFEAALELEETAEALLGLGGVPWWLKDTDGSLRCRERAYAAFRRRPDPFLAAGTAFQLAEHFVRPPVRSRRGTGWRRVVKQRC